MSKWSENTRVGLNPLGDIVLFCELCHETFEKKVQTKTVSELLTLSIKHRCNPIDVQLVEEAKTRAAVEKMMGGEKVG